MIQGTYQVGDIVTIRQYDEMFREFGENIFGGLNIPFSFSTPMQKFCGKRYQIREIEPLVSKDYNRIYLSDISGSSTINMYKFNEHMFEIPGYGLPNEELADFAIGDLTHNIIKQEGLAGIL